MVFQKPGWYRRNSKWSDGSWACGFKQAPKPARRCDVVTLLPGLTGFRCQYPCRGFELSLFLVNQLIAAGSELSRRRRHPAWPPSTGCSARIARWRRSKKYWAKGPSVLRVSVFTSHLPGWQRSGYPKWLLGRSGKRSAWFNRFPLPVTARTTMPSGYAGFELNYPYFIPTLSIIRPKCFPRCISGWLQGEPTL